MKTWLRGDKWEVLQGQTLNRFPIRSDKFDENELILPFHLTGEGFPSIWGPAHAFSIRLNHSDHRFDEKDAAYQEQCRQAARDLLTMVVAQFLGLLKPDEIPLEGSESKSAPTSRLLRLVKNNLETESRSMEALIVLRDPRLTGAPIAAINYPDCLWFPVHSYKLDMVGKRIEETLGRIDLTGLVPAQRQGEREKEGLKALVGQLRAYLREFLAAGTDVAPYARVLARFEDGLSRVSVPGAAPIRSGRAFGLALTNERKEKTVVEIELRRSVAWDGSEEFGGCPRCAQEGRGGQDWMNHPYVPGPLVLQGGSEPRRKVICPRDGAEIPGWDDLMSRSVFFDEVELEYVIWADDPTDEGAQDLQMPPNGERIEVQRGTNGFGQARFRFNRAEIIVKGRVVKRSDVLLRQVVELPRTTTVKALPISGDEANCIDWSAGGITEDESRKGSWNVYLRGGWRPFQWTVDSFRDPDLSEPENVSLLLWPGFEDKNWKSETLVYGVSKVRASGLVPPKVICYGPGKRSERVLGQHEGLDITRSMLHLKKRIEALEFRSPKNEPMGYLLPKRRAIAPRQIMKATIALDFGTSNTAVAWEPDPNKPEAIAMDQDAPPLELLAPTNEDNRERMAKSLSLLPFWPKQSLPRWCIPSELLYFAASEQWTIPHDSVEPPQFEKMDIRRDFKWKDEGNLHRQTYLSFILRMALANLRARGIDTVWLRATYPLAFERGQLTGYAEVLAKVVQELATATGMTFTVSGYANESVSGMEACGQKTGQMQCVIDFGGGTTDIAIRVLDPKKGFTDPLFVDSIRLAGNDVLDSLLSDPLLLEGLLQYGKAGLPSDARLATKHKVARQTILRELRSGNTVTPRWWRHLAEHQSGAAQRFGIRNRALFDGALAYALKLIAAAQDSMRANGFLAEGAPLEVAVFLLGQGWGLLRLQVEKGDYEPRSYVQNRLEELSSKLPAAPTNCRFRAIPPGYEIRNYPKLATGFGAVQLRDDHVQSAEVLEGRTGRETVFGLNVEFFDHSDLKANEPMRGFTDKQPIHSAVAKHDAWDQFVGPLLKAPGISDHVRQLFGPTETERRTFVDNTLTDLIDKKMAEQLAKGEILNTSPLLLLLERIWAQQLKRVEQ